MTDFKSLRIEIEHRRDHARTLALQLAGAENGLSIAREALECIAAAAHGATLYHTYENIRDIARKALEESEKCQ